MPPPGNWSAQQLAEFLAALATAESEEVANQRAVERAAEALESEVAALVRHDHVVTAIGFPPDRVPAEELVSIAEADARIVDLDDLGLCSAIAVPLEGDPDGHLVLARSSSRKFSPLETNLLRAMGRVLSLSLTALRTLAAERERRRVLDHLSRIQATLSHNAPLQEVLDAISAGARDLLAGEMAGILLVDEDNPEEMVPGSGVGVTEQEIVGFPPQRVGEGVAGLAVEEERLVVDEDFQATLGASPDAVRARAQAVIAAPIRERKQVVGALVVASDREGRRFTQAEREGLTAFADHAGLALSDSRLADQVQRVLHDPLTGLPNRSFVHEWLGERLGSDGQVAVVVLDIDSFRNVNDRLGPAVGDELLREMANRLRTIAGNGDIVARLGGDEFAFLPAKPEMVETIADAVLAGLREPMTLGRHQLRISASIGVSSDGRTTDEVLRNANLAMTRAEEQGGMRCVTYEPRMHSELEQRLELRDELVLALEHDELEAHFQPKVDIATLRVTGFEALVRWQHSVRGMLSPAAFLESAEAYGQMWALTRAVLEQALEVAGRLWRDDRHLQVSVNLSPGIFEEPEADLPGLVDLLLSRQGLPGRALQFEVTEDAIMRDNEHEARTLARLHERGVGLSIDDFGTGYSSLSRLRNLPVDELKIDRSFVMGLTDESGDLPIVRAAIELAHSMELGVVAEGVETKDAWACLHDLGCERAQGFLIAKPRPMKELESWLREWERDAERATVKGQPPPSAGLPARPLGLRESVARSSG